MRKVSNKKSKLKKVSNKKSKLKKVSNKKSKLKKVSNKKSKRNYFHKGGSIINIEFEYEETKIKITKFETPAYNNLTELLNKKINCIVKWKNRDDTENKYTFEIDINKNNPIGENLPHKIKSDTNIFIKIENPQHVIDKTKNSNTTTPSCLWLVSNEELKDDIYLGYIRTENRKCFNTDAKNKKIPQGEIMMNILIELSKLLNFKKIKLFDQSSKYCEPLKLPRNFRNTNLLKTGDTYYGKFGFRPEKLEDKLVYNPLSKLLKMRVVDLFKTDTIRELKNFYSKNLSAEYHSEKVDYLNNLLNILESNKLDKFNDVNKKLIDSDCMWEKVIYDLIEDEPSLFLNMSESIQPLLNEIYPDKKYNGLKTGKFEKMELVL